MRSVWRSLIHICLSISHPSSPQLQPTHHPSSPARPSLPLSIYLTPNYPTSPPPSPSPSPTSRTGPRSSASKTAKSSN